MAIIARQKDEGRGPIPRPSYTSAPSPSISDRTKQRPQVPARGRAPPSPGPRYSFFSALAGLASALAGLASALAGLASAFAALAPSSGTSPSAGAFPTTSGSAAASASAAGAASSSAAGATTAASTSSGGV